MVAGHLANLKRGSNQHTKEGESDDSSNSLQDAANLLNVGRQSVVRAKSVIDKGSAKLVEAVEQGSSEPRSRWESEDHDGPLSSRTDKTSPTVSTTYAEKAKERQKLSKAKVVNLPPSEKGKARDQAAADLTL